MKWGEHGVEERTYRSTDKNNADGEEESQARENGRRRIRVRKANGENHKTEILEQN